MTRVSRSMTAPFLAIFVMVGVFFGVQSSCHSWACPHPQQEVHHCCDASTPQSLNVQALPQRMADIAPFQDILVASGALVSWLSFVQIVLLPIIPRVSPAPLLARHIPSTVIRS